MTSSPESAPSQGQANTELSSEATALQAETPEMAEITSEELIELEDKNEEQDTSPINTHHEALIGGESNPFKLFESIKTSSERLKGTESPRDFNEAIADYQVNVGDNLSVTLSRIIEESTGEPIDIDPSEFHVDASWWSVNISNSGSYASMAATFDTAYGDFVTAKIDEILAGALLSEEDIDITDTEDGYADVLPDVPETEETADNFERFESLTQDDRVLADRFRGRFVISMTELIDTLDDMKDTPADENDDPKTETVTPLRQRRDTELVEARAAIDAVFEDIERHAA